MKTSGISPKVLWPVVSQLVLAIGNLIASQGFTKVVLGQIVSLVATAVIGFIVGPGVVGDGSAEPPHPEAG